MSLSNRKIPGVYINEVNEFPNSVVAVNTAVPAFIGYTPQASYEGKSHINVAKKVRSFVEFQSIYCYPDPKAPNPAAKQYHPNYYLKKQVSIPNAGHFVHIGNDYYSIIPDASTIYYLYNSIKLFFDNGGEDCYIVSVGTYGLPFGRPMDNPNVPLINPNVKLDELLAGIELLEREEEPTMYLVPEATLLSADNNGTLMKMMLSQNSEMQTAISIFDIIGGNAPDPITYYDDITAFRSNIGTEGLDFGTAYYPFLGTTVMQTDDLDYNNLFGGDTKQLKPILSPVTRPNATVNTILANIESPPAEPLTANQYNSALIAASSEYSEIIKKVLLLANILPPSGAMAGVITSTDKSRGVWKAPANISLTGVASLTINISSAQHEDLNVDALTGKSINAIRSFTGRGILVWGARTLDGNSLDWRYINVRRTSTMLEQSCRQAIRAYVFAPNNKNTWEAVKSMIGSFLADIWRQGGLMGAKPTDAFNVSCGLGTTMTPDDILRGYMNVTVHVALVRPAEFIVFSIQQQMPVSS